MRTTDTKGKANANAFRLLSAMEEKRTNFFQLQSLWEGIKYLAASSLIWSLKKVNFGKLSKCWWHSKWLHIQRKCEHLKRIERQLIDSTLWMLPLTNISTRYKTTQNALLINFFSFFFFLNSIDHINSWLDGKFFPKTQLFDIYNYFVICKQKLTHFLSHNF